MRPPGPSRMAREEAVFHTCHDVLHDGYHVGRLAEGRWVVILILQQKERQEAGWDKGTVGEEVQYRYRRLYHTANSRQQCKEGGIRAKGRGGLNTKSNSP